jgi:hypothetical protein
MMAAHLLSAFAARMMACVVTDDCHLSIGVVILSDDGER